MVAVEPLALRPRDAARVLGVCTRTLYSWVREGRIRPLKIGGTVLYPVETLRAFLSKHAEAAEACGGNN